MSNLINSPLGAVHLVSAIFALALGTIVLASVKGTRFHKRVGYSYATSMLVLNGTAFGIYHLFGRFGPFHIAALISMATLLAGIIPAVLRRPLNKWRSLHVPFMYYSVIGLYAAFASELIVRIPGVPFAGMVGLATLMVMAVGMWYFHRRSQFWMDK